MDGCKDGWMDWWWMDWWMEGWMDRLMDGRIEFFLKLKSPHSKTSSCHHIHDQWTPTVPHVSLQRLRDTTYWTIHIGKKSHSCPPSPLFEGRLKIQFVVSKRLIDPHICSTSVCLTQWSGVMEFQLQRALLHFGRVEVTGLETQPQPMRIGTQSKAVISCQSAFLPSCWGLIHSTASHQSNRWRR